VDQVGDPVDGSASLRVGHWLTVAIGASIRPVNGLQRHALRRWIVGCTEVLVDRAVAYPADVVEGLPYIAM
jgi:hypothetical protein